MKIFKSGQVAAIDKYTIENEPIKSINLMERAAGNMSEWIKKNIDLTRTFQVFAGPGNNGGDALAIARILAKNNVHVKVNIIRIRKTLSEDSEINYSRLLKIKNVSINNVIEEKELPVIKNSDIIIDGLFGSGLSRPLKGLAAETVKYINQTNSTVIAIDIPSGLFGEDNSENNTDFIIQADYTLALQFPSISFFLPETQKYVGQYIVIPIGLHEKIINKTHTDFFQIEQSFIKSLLKKRNKFDHKGNYGHALLISGSYGKMGAAVLGGMACLRTGAGLVTIHIPEAGYNIIQTSLPEAMVSIDKNITIPTETPDLEKYTAIATGPGIGTEKDTIKMIDYLLNKYNNPLVLDADALNLISSKKQLLETIPQNSILTPHPKEFERLFGKQKNTYNRIQVQIKNSVKYKIYIVLKGAHTSISTPEGQCWFNTTGNPGMATAGSGDVLTGIILSLLAQKYNSFEAALIGVYLHGLAGDIAKQHIGEQALIAGDICNNLGQAYLKIMN